MFMDIADVQVAKDKDKNLILPREHYSDHVATSQTSEYYCLVLERGVDNLKKAWKGLKRQMPPRPPPTPPRVIKQVDTYRYDDFLFFQNTEDLSHKRANFSDWFHHMESGIQFAIIIIIMMASISIFFFVGSFSMYFAHTTRMIYRWVHLLPTALLVCKIFHLLIKIYINYDNHMRCSKWTTSHVHYCKISQ